MPTLITSRDNQYLKRIRRAVHRESLTEDGFCILEGCKLIEEAVNSSCEVHRLFIARSREKELEAHPALQKLPLALVEDKLFEEVSAVEHSQGCLALVKPRFWQLEELVDQEPLILILDGIQIPGNVGTLLRAAEAFGASGVICLKGTANPYNPKAVRASAGSVLRVPLVTKLPLQRALEFVKTSKLTVLVGSSSEGQAPWEVNLRDPIALVLGAEGRGPSEAWIEAGSSIHIPTRRVESLNVAMAGSLLLYEASLQRMAVRRPASD